MRDQHYTNWTVAWICCFLTFLHLGVARLNGLLFVAVMEHFNVSRSEASLPFVLCYTIRNLSGPLIGYLGRRWGFYKVCVSGCILSTIGIGLCFFAESVFIITLMWGGVFGLGFGLSTILIPEVLRQHFNKDIAKANGVAFGGECLAGFVLPVLFDNSLRKYGTQGTFLILSGLVLNSLPAALLLNYKKPVRNLSSSFDNQLMEKKFDTNITTTVADDEKQYSSTFRNHEQLEFIQDSNSLCTSNSYKCSLPDSKHPLYCSYDHQKIPNSKENDKQYSAIASHYSSCPATIAHEKSFLEFSKTDENSQTKVSKRSAIKSFTVFFDLTFILMLVVQSLFIYITTTVLTIVVDFSKDIYVDSNEQIYIVMGMSIADLIGRFALGVVTDSSYMTNTAFSASCFFMMGILLFFTVWLKGFLLLMIVMLLFALLLGGLLIVFPGIVSEYIEEDKITMALASRMSLYGPFSLTQSYLIGFFRGQLGSYNGVFYMLIVLCFLCTALTVLTPFAAERRNRKTKVLNETDPILKKEDFHRITL